MSNIKNKFMPLRDKILLSKLYFIECINDTLMNTDTFIHSLHRFINRFIMNHVPAFRAFCFYDNKTWAHLGLEFAPTNNSHFSKHHFTLKDSFIQLRLNSG